MTKEEIALELLKAAMQRDVFKYVVDGKSYPEAVAEAYNTILENIHLGK